MKLVDWVQILVGVIILSLLIYLVQNAVDTGRSLGSLEVSVQTTTQRVDRIANALPDIGVRIATEKLNSRASTLVLASKLNESGANFYTVVDLKSGSATAYDLKLSPDERLRTFSAIAFSAREIDPSFTTLEELNEVARSTGELPIDLESIDGSKSFLLRSASWEDLTAQAKWLHGSERTFAVSAASGIGLAELRQAAAEAEKRSLDATGEE